MVAFPVAKLGAILIKQISKPLANLAKARAKQSPFFRNYVCMPPAQFYHWCEVKLKMWSMNLGKPVNIPKLNEASAIDLGAELVGEGLIFSIAAGVLIFEYVRQSRKESLKEAERVMQMELISQDLKTLYMEKVQQEAEIRELIRILQEKIPDAKFNPAPFDESSIPEHRREAEEAEPSVGAYNTVKGWVFNAIDFVLPPVNNTEPETTQIIIIQQKPVPVTEDKNCNREDSRVNKSSASSTINSSALDNNKDKR